MNRVDAMRVIAAAWFLALGAAAPVLCVAQDTPETLEQESAGGAAASNPTAAVRYQDVRYRYFDLSQGDKHSFETEGAFMLAPNFKVTNELRYVNTDSTGTSEQDFEELKIKGIYLRNIRPFGIKAKFALGAEWLKDLGTFEDGTGSGADTIAPLVGIGWVPNDTNFIVTLVQYFYSYDTDDSRSDDVRQTGVGGDGQPTEIAGERTVTRAHADSGVGPPLRIKPSLGVDGGVILHVNDHRCLAAAGRILNDTGMPPGGTAEHRLSTPWPRHGIDRTK